MNGCDRATRAFLNLGWSPPSKKISCPVSDHGKGRGDRRKSLSIRRVEDKFLVRCFAGCSLEAITAALGLEVGDLFDDNHRTPARESGDRRAQEASQDFEPRADLAAYQVKFRDRLTEELCDQLACQLGVSTAALDALGLGVADAGSLRELRAWGDGWQELPDWVYAFPERNAVGRIVGFSFRTVDGRKGCPLREVGCRRGLTFDPNSKLEGTTALVPEGASCTAAGLSAGLTVYGRFNNSGGAHDLADLLRNHSDFILLGENDGEPGGSWPGRTGVLRLATDLANTLQRPVRVAMPPTDFKDLREWFIGCVERGLDLTDPAACARAGEAFLQIVRSSSIIVEPGGSVGSVSDSGEDGQNERNRSDSSVGASPGDSHELTGDPEELPSRLPTVAKFTPDLLPDSQLLRVDDIAERMQCPRDFVAVALLVGLAGALGRRLGIRPKRLDTWLVVPNLWGAVVGLPSSLKSPAMREVIQPLYELENEARDEHAKAVHTHELDQSIAETKRKALQQKLQAAIRAGKGEEAAAAEEALRQDEKPPPKRRRHITRDTTVAKIGELLRDNPAGITIVRDELAGWIRTLDREGNEGDREFYLEAWNGDGAASCDRVGRGTIDAPSNTISVLGTLQPAIYHALLGRALTDPDAADGFLQRFQVVVQPDPPSSWRNVDRPPDAVAQSQVRSAFRRLASICAKDVDAAADPDDPNAIPYLHFAEDAQVLFDEWREALEKRLLAGDDAPAFMQHLGKYRSLIPSIALILHLSEGHTGPVSREALEMSIRWGTYLESHARRLYQSAVEAGIAPAHAIAAKILDGSLKDPIEKRYLCRKGWTDLTDPDSVQAGLDLLVDLHWLAVEYYRDSGNRERSRFRIHPKILERAGGCTDTSDRSQASSGAERSSDSPGCLAEEADPPPEPPFDPEWNGEGS